MDGEAYIEGCSGEGGSHFIEETREEWTEEGSGGWIALEEMVMMGIIGPRKSNGRNFLILNNLLGLSGPDGWLSPQEDLGSVIFRHFRVLPPPDHSNKKEEKE